MEAEMSNQGLYQGVMGEPVGNTLDKFLAPQNIVVLPSSARLRDCLVSMDQHGLRSLMIRLVNEQDDYRAAQYTEYNIKDHEFNGTVLDGNGKPRKALIQSIFRMFDMRDLLKYVLTEFDKFATQKSPPLNFLQLVLTGSSWGVANISGKNQVLPMWDDEPFLDAVRALQHSARVPIFTYDSANKIIRLRRIMSASDLFVMLVTKTDFMSVLPIELAAVFEATLSTPCRSASWIPSSAVPGIDGAEPGQSSGEVVGVRTSGPDQSSSPKPNSIAGSDEKISGARTPLGEESSQNDGKRLDDNIRLRVLTTSKTELVICMESEPLILCLRRFAETGVSAMPVVEDNNPRKCIGVISVRDFRALFLRPDDLGVTNELFVSATLQYLGKVRQLECLKAKFPSISVKGDLPLKSLLPRMMAADIHRILVVDSDGLLTGIFSRSDLGKLIASYLKQLLLIHEGKIK